MSDLEHTGWCELCKPRRRMPLEELLVHLRVEHDVNLDFETWPDGEIVVYDTTLGPGDFTKEET